MTQHHDPAHPADGDLGPDQLSAADDAFISAVLAGLPPVTMPADVAARIDAALAELPAAEAVAEPSASPTVVPFAARSGPAPGWRNPRVLQVAAVLVLVVGGGIVGIKTFAGHASAPFSASTEAAPAAGGAAEKTAITRSNRAYTAATLVADVHSLVASGTLTTGSLQAGAPGPEVPSRAQATRSTTPASGTSNTGSLDATLRVLTSSTATLAPCIATLEEGLPSYVDPIAVDAGTYEGKPALIVVLPGADDPTAYFDVWIVGPACGKNKDSNLIRYQSVPRG
jgi:hypothetical protein